MFRLTSALLAGCLATGCISTDAVYPVTWAGRVKLDSKQCPSLDGEYGNVGDVSLEHDFGAYSVTAGTVSLADILAGQAEGQPRLNFASVDATTDVHRSVNLRTEGETLHVTVHRVDGSSRSLELPIGSHCDGSMVDAGADWKGNTIILASEVDRSSMKLGRADDGALVVRTSQSMGWFITYVPIFGTKDERWLRFPAFTPEPESPESVAEVAAAPASR
jgi:hypothetical protein